MTVQREQTHRPGAIRPRACRRARRALAALCLAATALSAVAETGAAPEADWVQPLQAELARIDAAGRYDLGVYVRDLDSGRAASWRAEETWYLASTVKLPVALAVLEQVQRGVFTLDTTVTLRTSDYVDGAGATNRQPVGARPTVRWLLEQMMMYSDNTASDMLIDLVGLRSVNALVQRVVPDGFQHITTLADVRRHLYSGLTPAAAHLSGRDFLKLHAQRDDLGRRQLLSELVHVPLIDFRLPTLVDAYEAYYATGLNSGRLDAYGELLARVVQGEVLDKPRTAWLLALMERTKTGPKRIRAGLPKGTRWAHKTGTQIARTCDSGVITVTRAGRDQHVVVAACTRGERSLGSAERALLQVGAAICRSGLLGVSSPSHDLSCRAQTMPDRPPDGGPHDGVGAGLR